MVGSPGKARRKFEGFAGALLLWVSAVVLLTGCSFEFDIGRLIPFLDLEQAEADFQRINPFSDTDPIQLDGVAREIGSTISRLGALSEGEVLRIEVTGEGIDAVLVLASDVDTDSAGVIVGGGTANAQLSYRIPYSGEFAVFVQYDPEVDEFDRAGTLSVGPGDAAFVPPAVQPVLVEFAPDFLTNPGLFDPDSGTTDELSVLDAISETVREGVLSRLETIFAGTPVVIVSEGDPIPDEPYSIVTILPDRVVADDPLLTDAALPPTDPSRAECSQRVVFGEVLPRGAKLDPGNQVRDDVAVVYVGSFQGRGANCRSAALDSVNNVVLGIAQTAAHEIGHLIGLFHVPLTDLMDRSPTLAFQRELSFQRGQVLIDATTELSDGTTEASSLLLTSVIQDPAIYFTANFAP